MALVSNFYTRMPQRVCALLTWARLSYFGSLLSNSRNLKGNIVSKQSLA